MMHNRQTKIAKIQINIITMTDNIKKGVIGLLFFIGRKTMVYKIGNILDLESVPIPNKETYDLLYHHASVLTYEYEQERNVDTDDGGFILYCSPNTKAEDIKAFFDFTKHTVESVDRYGELVVAMWILNNEFVITIISANDVPIELINEII